MTTTEATPVGDPLTALAKLPAAEKAPIVDNLTRGLVPLSATEYQILLDQQKKISDSHARCAKEYSTPVKGKDGVTDIFSEEETVQVTA
ncbi:hypothetical protein HK104_009569 [Borealophlyctis nickersoniae]|nr:hypothetical protein HK104_009569 [Borealophlyctis nickersoniae]